MEILEFKRQKKKDVTVLREIFYRDIKTLVNKFDKMTDLPEANELIKILRIKYKL